MSSSVRRVSTVDLVGEHRPGAHRRHGPGDRQQGLRRLDRDDLATPADMDRYLRRRAQLPWTAYPNGRERSRGRVLGILILTTLSETTLGDRNVNDDEYRGDVTRSMWRLAKS